MHDKGAEKCTIKVYNHQQKFIISSTIGDRYHALATPKSLTT